MKTSAYKKLQSGIIPLSLYFSEFSIGGFHDKEGEVIYLICGFINHHGRVRNESAREYAQARQLS